MKRILTIAGAALGVLILILILIPLFVSANTFRPKLESMASQALGRKVQIGNLGFSLFSGSLSADNGKDALHGKTSEDAPEMQQEALKWDRWKLRRSQKSH